MMNCRGMGAVTKKGNKGPIERKMGGKMVKRKMGGRSSTPIEDMPGFSLSDPRSYNRDAMSGGRRMAKGKKVKPKMKAKGY